MIDWRILPAPMAGLLGAALALSAVPEAKSASRTLQFEIEPIIMLNCVEQVEYSVDVGGLLAGSSLRTPTISAAGTSFASARMIEARFSASDLAREAENRLVEIDIEDACSVRGLGRGEGFMVDVKPSSNGALTTQDGDGLLAVRDARGRPSYGGTFERRFAIPQQRIRLDAPIGIDVQLRVDMSFAQASGEYSSPVDGVFSIEVTAP